ncbi:hypothetical protein PsorP6_012904 [Peronosclerospora sorghi]|uniref:Uncharacterized protein n=1 Tax=Peronosclerospora sorghi TaxID=230839 RepID=A0ACC0WIG2_9STRA|nr:hypothetical protein PsorP6_012904 [Peronosclerospora sorghi]
MDVKTIATKYGGLPARLVARAEENWRVTRAKKSSGLDQFAGPVACILVAARALSEQVDPTRLAKCAGAPVRWIEPTVRKIVDAIGVETVIQTTPAALCIKFGCEALTPLVSRVYQEYRAFLEQMAEQKKKQRGKHPHGPTGATINHEDPVFIAACLYAVSKQAKMNVKQEQLVQAVCGNAKEFDAIVSSIEVQCQTSLGGATMDRRKRQALFSEHASMKLTKLQRLEQLQEEERAKRQKFSLEAKTTPTRTQSRVLDKLYKARALSREQIPRCTGVAATPAEYAEWRANALAFMRNKKKTPPSKEDTRVSMSTDDTL